MTKKRLKQGQGRGNGRKVAGYGWIPDLPDARDYLFWIQALLSWRTRCRPRLTFAPCAAHRSRIRANWAVVRRMLSPERSNLWNLKIGVPFADPLSRLFIYYNERSIEHTVKTDSGAMMRDGIKTLAAQGVSKEALTGLMKISQFAAKPPRPLAYADAGKHLDHLVRTPPDPG